MPVHKIFFLKNFISHNMAPQKRHLIINDVRFKHIDTTFVILLLLIYILS